jgi:hypothetical protein
METPWDIIWQVAAKDHTLNSAYPPNSVTLLTEKIVDLRAYDSKEIGGVVDRRTYGNNYYSVSNIDQWLNKDSPAGQWYVAATAYDGSPSDSMYVLGANTQYSARPGFLYYFTPDEKASILDTTIRVDKPNYDGGGIANIVRKVFLLSVFETGTSIPSAKLPIFTDDASRVAYMAEQAFNNTLSTNKPALITNPYMWHVRTPVLDSYVSANYVPTNGYSTVGHYAADGHIGVRPACNVSNTLMVSETPDADGCYTLIWWAPPTSN